MRKRCKKEGDIAYTVLVVSLVGPLFASYPDGYDREHNAGANILVPIWSWCVSAPKTVEVGWGHQAESMGKPMVVVWWRILANLMSV